MDTLVVCATVIAVAVTAAAVWWLSHSFAWRALQRRRVLVVLDSGEGLRSVEGILWERRGPLYVLRDAYALGVRGGDAPTHVDGELVLERNRVVWVQVLPS
jgi:hypothetical protein